VKVQLDQGETRNVKDGTGVRKGYVSSLLFNYTTNIAPRKLLNDFETSE
jgi:hypothetical protein